VDIALDPFPYPGITTSVENLWMGVPVLTLSGNSFLSRQGVGLLMNAGLPDWIATDADEYVALALSHSSDLQRLSSLRAGLRQRVLASPIFDAPLFARHFEAALRGMWQKWCGQQH
jgi:predicted O-linked N-acetylglucosamine transferase (SPINDLY family)